MISNDLKIFRARAREPPPCAARTPQPPPSATKRLLLAADGHKTGRYQKILVTFSRAPAYIHTCHRFHARFFACPLGTMPKICQLWRPTYLPPRAPRKAAPKGAGMGAGVAGEVAQYHGRFCFCCAHALMCGFQYKCPPSPLAI